MLQQLSIKNFALIDKLVVNFNEGFTIITGETGAGKSIILGGLALILGKRADLSSLKNSDSKCVIEGDFLINKYSLESFFVANDIDFEEQTIIRREILPSGKSRAFINDTPVNLTVLNELSKKLVDIHSQHETLQLADNNFQFQIIDALANNINYLNTYSKELSYFNKLNKEFDNLLKSDQEAKLQYDYNLYLLEELNQSSLKPDEQIFLEETLDKLNNIESIKQYFNEAITIANDEQFGLKLNLNNFKDNLIKLASFSKSYQELADRINSINIEFDDIIDELEKANEEVSCSPEEIKNYNERLQLIYDLQKKHAVSSITELLTIQESLSIKVDNVANASKFIEAKKNEIKKIEKKLNNLATTIHKNRLKIIPDLIKQLEDNLASLAMQNTKFKIDLIESDSFYANGKDNLKFLFSANKGSNFEPLKKVASGGEMSRIMLTIKSLLSKHTNLPTILFDEIDTGVSGEVSNRMATIMDEMSTNMQVISITHLPQIAARGKHHFKVFKKEINNQTKINIKQLNNDERITELAEMLSGKKIASSAIEHAKQLLN